MVLGGNIINTLYFTVPIKMTKQKADMNQTGVCFSVSAQGLLWQTQI